jgi:hypothetical protein
MKQHLVAVGSFLLVASLAAPAAAGIHYRGTTKTDAAQGQDQSMEVEAWVEGDNAKVAFTSSSNPLLAAGTYLLTTDGGKTLTLVNPEEKTYSELDLGALVGAAGAMFKGLGPMVKLSFANQQVERLAEEPGPAILGYPTTHYRYRVSYDFTFKVMGMGQSSHHDTVTDIWATRELTDSGFGAWLRREPPRTGIDDLDRLIAAEMGKGVQGVPLKMVAVAKTRDQRGNETEATTTTEVLAIKEEAVPAGSFAIPKGFERTELVPSLGE